MHNNVILKTNVGNVAVNKKNIIIELDLLLLDVHSLDVNQYELIRLLITYSYLNYENKNSISYNGNYLNVDSIKIEINNLISKLQEKHVITFKVIDLLILVTNSSKFFKSSITKTFKNFLKSLPYILFFDFRFDIKVHDYLMRGLDIGYKEYFPRSMSLNLYNWINNTNDYTQKIARIKAGNILFYGYIHNNSVLHLCNLGLTSLPDNVINKFTFVKKINLFNNKISFISKHIFRNMKNLIELNISQQFVELDFADKAFESTNLKKLSSAYNLHKDIPKALMYLNNLEDLSICSNQITEIKEYDFQYCSKLTNLDMDFNQLENIHPNAFKNCSILRFVSFKVNNLRKLPTGLFSNLFYLEEITFFTNKIDEIQKGVFFNVPKLSYLILANNRLRALSPEALNDIFFNLIENNININFGGNGFNSTTKINIKNFFREFKNIKYLISDNILMDKLEYIDNCECHNEIAHKLLNIFLNIIGLDCEKFIIDNYHITINFIDLITMENIKDLSIKEKDKFLNSKFIFLNNSNNVFNIYLYESIEEFILSRSIEQCYNPITKKIINASEIIGGKELFSLLDQIILFNKYNA